jgi:hypothetical protein
MSKRNSSDTSNITKALNFQGRLLMMSKTAIEYDEQEGLQTPPTFNEFEVLKDDK